jgi:F-type H+-transporting ATPase subunit b
MKYILTVIMVFALAAVAFAAGGADAEGGESGSVLVGFLIQIMNFVVIFGAITFFFGKSIKKFFTDRTAAINDAIVEAREAREAAEKALAEVQSRLDSSDQEVKKMVQAARDSGERERERLISEGERMSQRIIEQAKAGIEFELNQALEGLKAEAAEYALELAEVKLGQKLGDTEQKKLLEDAIVRLEERA